MDNQNTVPANAIVVDHHVLILVLMDNQNTEGELVDGGLKGFVLILVLMDNQNTL